MSITSPLARYAKGARLASLRRGFSAAATRAKLPAGLRMHDRRHRCGTGLLARGADVVKVQGMLGHADVRTTMRYCHLSREHLRGLPGMVERPASAARAG